MTVKEIASVSGLNAVLGIDETTGGDCSVAASVEVLRRPLASMRSRGSKRGRLRTDKRYLGAIMDSKEHSAAVVHSIMAAERMWMFN